jgi:ABC-type spermidine/putrescine transport system permease subunit II
MIASLSVNIGRIAYRAVVTCCVIFLLTPLVAVVLMSFSDASFITFPPKDWGTQQYASLIHSERWATVTLRSFAVAVPVALGAVGLACLLVLGLHRTRVPYKEAIIGFCTIPLLVPGVALAIAIYDFFAKVDLLDNFIGVVLAHTVYTLPIAVLVLWPAMRSISPQLELVAMTLGAGRVRAWVGITLRLLVPSLIAAGIIAFLTSFDEATLVAFITGPNTATLPKEILDSVSTGVDPTITAIATLLVLITALLLAISEVLRARSNK